MTFDVRDYLPSPANWFAAEIEYQGWGVADFADPKGSIEGPVTIRYSESGRASAEMILEPGALRSERTLRFGLMEFLSGAQPRVVDGSFTFSPSSSQNPCVNLRVETSEGVIRTGSVVAHGYRTGYGWDNEGDPGEQVSFEFYSAEYEGHEPTEPRYWVLPLINFVSDLRWSRPELDRHPLRIFPTTEVPEEITRVRQGPDKEEHDRRAMLALLAANHENRLITFDFNGALGFVERLPDFENRRDSLLRGDAQTRLTAVMVGEIGPNPTADFDEIAQWLHPADQLSLLTLATGTEVGSPWVEIRDAEGRLVRRSHQHHHMRQFRKGHQLVEERPFKDKRSLTGIGRLITRAMSCSSSFGEGFLRVAIWNLVRSKYDGQTFEESLAYLCRGLDGLCETHEVARKFLRDSLNAAQQEAVKEVLSRSAKEIRELKRAAKAGNDQNASAALSTIESNISNADNTERKFGHAVTDLLDRFELPDV